jgi:hypothetical protein
LDIVCLVELVDDITTAGVEDVRAGAILGRVGPAPDVLAELGDWWVNIAESDGKAQSNE